jgi:SnoaL-like polyketide cyclase
MATTTDTNSRTARLLTLMKKGDDAFNARDWATVDAVHHPDMIAYITGLAEPIYGKQAHGEAMRQFLRIFPDMHVYSDPYPIQFGSGDWITVVTNATGTFSGEMTLPDGTVIPPTGKAFDVEFGQTSKWDGDRLIVISAFWDAARQRQQIGLA